MKRLASACCAVLILSGCQQPADSVQALANEYVESWASFYPSRALSAGRAEAALLFEDLSPQPVHDWLEFNQQALKRLHAVSTHQLAADRIDRRLLEQQIRRELFRWGELQVHRTNPLAYSDLINHSLTPVLVRQNLTDSQKADSVIKRMQGLQRLCDTARSTLVDGRPASTDAAVRHIRSTAAFIDTKLAAAVASSPGTPSHQFLVDTCAQTASALTELARWLEEDLGLSLNDAHGEALYARELDLAYGGDLSPAILEQMATAEIQAVRGLMDSLARSYWKETREEPVPADFGQLIQPVLADMERNRAGGQEEFLQVFLDLIDRSERFLEETNLIDLPRRRTLFTDLSPAHFAGAAVGGVYSAGPFNPEVETLFYLPTVPDSAPEQARDDFYRSFNNHFNTMIITHEIYPGHYLQLKAAASNPRPTRALFAGNDFTEGWASFCEEMMLDAGWDGDHPLTRMAHLRKRLENAVRASVSVQVHCRDWGRDQVQTFAVETGLLPPQFAENLWHRALFSPIQLPSYFVGYRGFVHAHESERARLGERFSLEDFNNAVVLSGGVPMDVLAEHLSERPGPS